MFAGGTCPQSVPAGIVYIGDSFATRFERFCRARAMSNGGLDPLTISLSVIGKGGARLSFATDAASRITSSKADMAIIHLGSNDLNDCVCEAKQLAADILNIARRFIRVDGFKESCHLSTVLSLPALLRIACQVSSPTAIQQVG